MSAVQACRKWRLVWQRNRDPTAFGRCLAGILERVSKQRVAEHRTTRRLPVDGTTRICEIVRYYTTEITLKGAWTGPGSLELHPHALAPLADLPVLKVESALHFVADLTLDLGEVVYDYLAVPLTG